MSETLRVEISDTTAHLLDELVMRGIYGADRQEVAVRMIDTALQRFVAPPTFTLPVPPEQPHA